MKLKLFLFIFLFFLVSFNYAQNNVDAKIDYYIANSQNDSAQVLILQQFKKQAKNNLKLADYNIKYARVLKALTKTDSAFYYLDKAENFFKKNPKLHKEKLFYISSVKAEFFRYLAKRKEAITYIYDASKNESENFNPDILAYFYNRKMAIISTYYNNVPDSVKVIEKLASKIIKNEQIIRDKSLVAYTYNEMGFLKFNFEHEEANEYFIKGLQIAEKYHCTAAIADISLNLGRLNQYHYLDYPKAIEYYKKSLDNAKKTKNLWQIKEAHFCLRQAYTLNLDYKNALIHMDSTTHYLLQIAGRENNLLLTEIENKYDFEKKEQEVLSYKKNIYLLIIAIISLFTGIFIMLFYNKKIKNKNKELVKLYEENKFLVSETNHRVNNNLQIINLLINEMQSKFEGNEQQKDLEGLIVKVDTIATLHRHLYQTKNNDFILLNKYLEELLINFDENLKKENVEFKSTIEQINIDSEKAMFIGLLTTELMINSLKHAFQKNQEKKISLYVKITNNIITYIYKDNGINSIGKKFEPKLVSQICLQLDSKLNINTTDGFTLDITIKI